MIKTLNYESDYALVYIADANHDNLEFPDVSGGHEISSTNNVIAIPTLHYVDGKSNIHIGQVIDTTKFIEVFSDYLEVPSKEIALIVVPDEIASTFQVNSERVFLKIFFSSQEYPEDIFIVSPCIKNES